MAGQKLPVRRPRIRSTTGQGEAALETYRLLQSEGAMPEAAFKRLVRGVSCRDYEGVVDLACEGSGVKKSSVLGLRQGGTENAHVGTTTAGACVYGGSAAAGITTNYR